MKKEEAIGLVNKCAELYRDNLENNNLLFVFSRNNNPEALLTHFLPRHFHHLTGVKSSKSSVAFYDACLANQLSPNDIELPDNGTVEMKLSVLPQLMRLQIGAKMMAFYDDTKIHLYTEMLAGNVKGCIGFVREGEYYSPNTALREDIRMIGCKPIMRVHAIFRKAIAQKSFSELTYISKGLTLNDPIIGGAMESANIDPTKLTAAFEFK